MSANPKPLVGSDVDSGQYHVYHADAQVLSGQLERPIQQQIEHYGRVVLENTRRDGIVTQSVGATNVKGLISFKSGHTRVLGSQVHRKVDLMGNDHSGWITLSTAVLEGFNVLDMITADRVVAQVSTRHPLKEGHVPTVTFLGSRFENLEIAGQRVTVHLNLDICGNKPADDRPYLQDINFLNRVQSQIEELKGSAGTLPEGLEEKYRAEVTCIDDLKKNANGGVKGEPSGYSKLQCTLIKSIDPIDVPGVEIFGNVIFVPNFGTVTLGEVEVGTRAAHTDFRHRKGDASSTDPTDSNYFTLHMIKMQLGCPTGGGVNGPTVNANGHHGPGGG